MFSNEWQWAKDCAQSCTGHWQCVTSVLEINLLISWEAMIGAEVIAVNVDRIVLENPNYRGALYLLLLQPEMCFPAARKTQAFSQSFLQFFLAITLFPFLESLKARGLNTYTLC